MKLVVTGGRDFRDAKFAFQELDRLDRERGPFEAVAHGGCSGADALAGLWAQCHKGKQEVIFTAHWDRDGKAAGPIRNRRMLELFEPDLVVAFPGGRGTLHCVQAAKALGIEVVEVAP